MTIVVWNICGIKLHDKNAKIRVIGVEGNINLLKLKKWGETDKIKIY